MTVKLFLGQNSLEYLNEVGRRNNFHSEAADQLDRSRIDARHVRNRVHRRILHRDLFAAGERLLEEFMQLLPWQIDVLIPRKGIQRCRFDRMNDLLWRTGCRNEIEPPARGELCGVQSQNVLGDRIAPTEAVKQPAVELV